MCFLSALISSICFMVSILINVIEIASLIRKKIVTYKNFIKANKCYHWQFLPENLKSKQLLNMLEIDKIIQQINISFDLNVLIFLSHIGID